MIGIFPPGEGCGMQDVERRMQDAGCRMQNAGCGMENGSSSILILHPLMATLLGND
jgi:hypothetical protein